MIPRAIAQAVLGDGGLLARSDDFDEALRPDLEQVAAGFGLPPNTQAPDSLFAVPLGRRVAVASVSGRRFRFLVMAKALYDVIPDPFAIADRFPPAWDRTGPLPPIEWPEEPLPRRTVAQLDGVLKHGEGPFLLGASQTLVDSGRILLVRDAPQPALVRDVWALLPDSTRRHTWPATFAYSVALGFSFAVLPAVPDGVPPGYLTEDQARDYPESRYERELQFAVEHADQRSLDRLLARRTSAETLRLALWLVLGATALSLATRFLMAL